jgi:hypothetical protein
VRRPLQVALVLIVGFAVAQVIRPTHANPPVDRSRTIDAQPGTSAELAAVLDRSCGDCHSNRTAWRWYTQVAPVSWLMSYGVAKGREAVNFSEWAAYPPERRRQLLDAVCRDVSSGRMPGAYAVLRPETRLSAGDLQTICRGTGELAREVSP